MKYITFLIALSAFSQTSMKYSDYLIIKNDIQEQYLQSEKLIIEIDSINQVLKAETLVKARSKTEESFINREKELLSKISEIEKRPLKSKRLKVIAKKEKTLVRENVEISGKLIIQKNEKLKALELIEKKIRESLKKLPANDRFKSKFVFSSSKLKLREKHTKDQRVKNLSKVVRKKPNQEKVLIKKNSKAWYIKLWEYVKSLINKLI